MAEKTPAERLIEIEKEQEAIEAKMEFIDDHLGDGDRNMADDEKELKELQAKWDALDEEKNKLLQPLRF